MPHASFDSRHNATCVLPLCNLLKAFGAFASFIQRGLAKCTTCCTTVSEVALDFDRSFFIGSECRSSLDRDS